MWPGSEGEIERDRAGPSRLSATMKSLAAHKLATSGEGEHTTLARMAVRR